MTASNGIVNMPRLVDVALFRPASSKSSNGEGHCRRSATRRSEIRRSRSVHCERSLPMFDTEHGVDRRHGLERRQRCPPPDLHVGSSSRREQEVALDARRPIGDWNLN